MKKQVIHGLEGQSSSLDYLERHTEKSFCSRMNKQKVQNNMTHDNRQRQSRMST